MSSTGSLVPELAQYSAKESQQRVENAASYLRNTDHLIDILMVQLKINIIYIYILQAKFVRK